MHTFYFQQLKEAIQWTSWASLLASRGSEAVRKIRLLLYSAIKEGWIGAWYWAWQMIRGGLMGGTEAAEEERRTM